MATTVREVALSVRGKAFARVRVRSGAETGDPVSLERRVTFDGGETWERVKRHEVGADCGLPIDRGEVAKGVERADGFARVDDAKVAEALAETAIPTLQIEFAMSKVRVPWARVTRTYWLLPSEGDATVKALMIALRSARAAFVVRFHVKATGPQRLGVMFEDSGVLCVSTLHWSSVAHEIAEDGRTISDAEVSQRHLSAASSLVSALRVEDGLPELDSFGDEQREAVAEIVAALADGEERTIEVPAEIEVGDPLAALEAAVLG